MGMIVVGLLSLWAWELNQEDIRQATRASQDIAWHESVDNQSTPCC